MMIRELDRKRAYGEVYGMLGAAFEQDGIYFNIHGLEVGAEVPEGYTRPKVDQQKVKKTRERVDADQKAEAKTAADKSDDELRTLMASFGGFFTNRADALEFLKDKI